MSSIHYKFRATLEYKTLSFDGLSILASELKREICTKENIKAEAFDLVLQNAHTKRQYAADEQIPRNISIIVQRVPKEDGEKLPKIQGVNTGMVQRADASMDSGINVTGHIVQSEFDKLTEEERLTHIKSVSTSKFDPSNYQKRPSGALTGPPPPTYTCNRCHQPGHWFKNCPLLNQKRTTGIPSQELMETTADDPQAMLHPSGKYVIPIMHWRARQHKKNVEGAPVLEKQPPKELICPLCDHLFKDAVVTTCCGISFCADCISQSLLESEDRNCPGENCNKTQVSVDSLVPNRMLRQMVSNWEAGGTAGEAHERVRIGLAPSSNTQLASSASLSGRSPSTQAYQPPVSSVPVTTTAPMPVYSLPQQQLPFPTSFAQPPPNMIVMAPTEPLVPPGTTTVIPSSTLAPLVPAALPPIPGVQMVNTTYNPTPKSSAQFMDAWEAFLNRNDKPSSRDRDYGRRRKRSRERRRSRSPSDDRKRSRRGRDRDERRDRDRSKERSKRRDYDSKDSHRSRHKTDADSDKERKRRKEKREDRSPEKKRSKEDKPEVDEEAAIDDALKEVEEMNMLNKSDGSDGGDVDAGLNVSKSPREQGSQSETSDRGGTSAQPSPDAKKSSELESTPVKEASPRNRSSDSESTQGKSEEADKMDEGQSDKEKSEHEDGKKEDDSEKRKKDKKIKKHKKEKKHKKDRNETEEERKERKKLKKEKKEKKRREKEERTSQKDKDRKRRVSDSDDDREKTRKGRKEEKDERESRDRRDRSRDRHREKERSSRHDKKEEKSRTEKGSRKEDETEGKASKSPKSTKLGALAATKDDFSANAVVDEKQIRDHFSPPPSLLQTKKITLNI